MAEQDKNNLELEVKQLISAVTGRAPEEMTLETDLARDVGIDSIKAIEIAVNIERKYKVRVRDEEVAKITTVGQTVDIVRDALNRK